MKLYSIKSLDELAALFEKRAAMAKRQSESPGINKKHQALYNREQGIWGAAAEIVRNTELRRIGEG